MMTVPGSRARDLLRGRDRPSPASAGRTGGSRTARRRDPERFLPSPPADLVPFRGQDPRQRVPQRRLVVTIRIRSAMASLSPPLPADPRRTQHHEERRPLPPRSPRGSPLPPSTIVGKRKAKPRPLPGSLVVKNGSKRRGRSPAGIRPRCRSRQSRRLLLSASGRAQLSSVHHRRSVARRQRERRSGSIPHHPRPHRHRSAPSSRPPR